MTRVCINGLDRVVSKFRIDSIMKEKTNTTKHLHDVRRQLWKKYRNELMDMAEEVSCTLNRRLNNTDDSSVVLNWLLQAWTCDMGITGGMVINAGKTKAKTK